MSAWRLIKQFPKYLIVIGVVMTATVLFGFWWYFRFSFLRKDNTEAEKARQAKIEEVAVTLPAKVGHLLLADGDLYDLDSGRLLLKQWLKEKQPLKLYYDEEFQKMIGRYPLGLVRFNLNGRQEAAISWQHGLVIDDAMETALFARENDIWKARVDLRAFQLIDEQRVTTTGAVMERYFAQSLLLRTPSILVLRNLNQILRVDLISGQVTSVKMQLPGMKDNRSPDGAVVVAATAVQMKPKFFAYDLEKDESKIFDLDTRSRITAFQWLNRDRCAFVEGGLVLKVYDRQTQEIEKVMDLPIQCSDIAKPSPSGRFVFCGSFRESVLVDTESKKAEPLKNPAQNYEWVADDVLLCAWDVPDSDQRGTWLWKVGTEESRVSTEPYTFTRHGPASVLGIKEAGLVTFATKGGLFRVEVGGGQAELFAPIKKPVTQFMFVEKLGGK